MKYKTNNIGDDKFSKIVTLLDINEDIKTYLDNIQIKSITSTTILIDTLLIHGYSEDRFISVELDNNGKPEISTTKFITPDNKTLKTATNVLLRNKSYVKLSVLTKNEKNKILDMIEK